MNHAWIRSSLVAALAFAFSACSPSSQDHGIAVSEPPPFVFVPPPPPPPPPDPSPFSFYEWKFPSLAGVGQVPGCYLPKVATDAAGNAMAVWYQEIYPPVVGPSSYVLWYRRYLVGDGWESPQVVTSNIVQAQVPRIAMDAQGNALIVYHGPNPGGIGSAIFVVHFDSQTGLGATETFQPVQGSLGSCSVAMNASGNGVVAFSEEWGGSPGGVNHRSHVWAARYEAGTGWIEPELIEPFDSVSRLANVAMNANGEAMVVWEQSTYPGPSDIWAVRFDGTDWESPVLIEPQGGYPAGNASESVFLGPKVGMDDSGYAIAVWVQEDEAWAAQNTITSIWANHYVPGSGWGSPVALENDPTAVCRVPALSVNPDGVAVVAWTQRAWGNAPPEIRAVRHEGQGWTSPASIGSGHYVQAATDAEGNAVLVWDDISIMSSVFNIGTGWTSPEEIDMEMSGGTYPTVALSANGLATCVWQQNLGGGARDIGGNRRE